MKKLFFITLLMCLLLHNVSAQDDEMKTIFGPKDGDRVKVDGFGSLDVMASQLIDQDAMLVGAHGGVIFNKKIMLGAGGFGFVTQHKFDGIEPEKDLHLYGGYGGIIVGFNVAPKEVVHASFPILIGAGGFEVYDREFLGINYPDEEGFIIESSSFFVVHPMATVEVNMTRFFRLALGAGYRHISGTDLVNVKEEDLSSWTANLSFKFGGF